MASLQVTRIQLRGVELVSETSSARWIEDRLWSWPDAQRRILVGSVVPEGYAAYARILHPAHRRISDGVEPLTWSQVAELTGRRLDESSRFHEVAALTADPNEQPTWGMRPQEGSLSQQSCRVLADLLADVTRIPERCFFCVWCGYGFMRGAMVTWGTGLRRRYGVFHPDEATNVPRIRTPHREYYVYQGAVASADFLFRAEPAVKQSPNLWWPEDRAWCVATAVDLDSTFIGGSADCIDRVLRNSHLETLPANIDNLIGEDSSRS